jgi:hypothetical protein
VPTTTTLGKALPSFSQTRYIKSQSQGKAKRKMPHEAGKPWTERTWLTALLSPVPFIALTFPGFGYN